MVHLQKYIYKLSSDFDETQHIFRLYNPIQRDWHITDTSFKTYDFVEFINDIKLAGKVGLLYVGGEAHHSSELRYTVETDSTPQKYVLSQMSYMLNRYAEKLSRSNDIVYANIINTGSASGVWALKEADNLINSGACDYVIVVSEDKIQQSNLDMLKEYQLPAILGEGMLCCIFGREEGIPIGDITTKYDFTLYSYPESSKLTNVLSKSNYLVTYYNILKDTINDDYGTILSYTNKHGLLQGMSALVDMLMFVEDNTTTGTASILSYGYGGFYGSFVVDKG